MHRCAHHPENRLRRYTDRRHLGKKLEMIDDRPILGATYGVAYPPACSHNGRRRNLFPNALEMSRLRCHSSKFLLNDPRVCVRLCVPRTKASRVYFARSSFFTRTFDASIRGWRDSRARENGGERETGERMGTEIEKVRAALGSFGILSAESLPVGEINPRGGHMGS